MGAILAVAALRTVSDFFTDAVQKLCQSGAQGVVRGLIRHVWAGRGEVSGDAKRRADLKLVLNEYPGLVYAEAGAKSGEFLLYESGEGGGGLVMAVLKYQFHDAACLTPEIGFE